MAEMNQLQTTMIVGNLAVSGLLPGPDETWKTMLRFSGPTSSELDAMRHTVDTLFQRGYELVVGTYDHLRRIPETAAILGWEQGFDETHLAERRLFFTIWLARTLSIDLGTDFADILFRAGQVHAGHGPRHIHTPPMWVIGSMGLVVGTFARFIQEAGIEGAVGAPALAGWNKYLMTQLNQMLTGYESARVLEDGEFECRVKVYGRVRHEWGRESIIVKYRSGETVGGMLRRLVSYAPILRNMLFEQTWRASDEWNEAWMHVEPVYVLRGNWRVLVDGQDVRYYGGFERVIKEGNTLDLFPPGR